MILFFLRTALIRTIHTLQAEEGKLFRKPAFLKATQIIFQIYVKVMDLFSITTLIRITHILLQGDPQQQTHRAATHIKLVHWNAQGTIKKTSAIKKSIVQDDLDIVMIQDTRYTRRLDDLPNLRIHVYHTYHRAMDEVGHGMVTMIKHNTIRGSGTNTLRRWH